MPYYFNEMKKSLQTTLCNLKNHIYFPLADLDMMAWVTQEPVSYADRMSGRKECFSVGQQWGKLWDCAWFHFTGTLPKEAAGKDIVLLIDLSGEGCVFDENGCPIQGLTTYSSEFETSLGRPGKKVVRFRDNASGGEKVDLWVDAGCNDLFGKYQDSGTIKEACIAVINKETRALYYDFAVLYGLMEQLPENSARAKSILFALFHASQLLNGYTKEETEAAGTVLSTELNKKGGDPSLWISAVGHAHIDLAWLWPLRETIRKGARTFSTALMMLDRYPDYVFGASQPQLYQWMKELYPELYKKITQQVKAGRWETQGAMWVEADTNITGGESLVRQILYGKRFFQQEFGIDQKMLWLPDVFGYSGSLPQLLKKSGVEYFMTIKLSWSKFNVYPHHTFFWQGIDGSRVLTHMPPEGTYNSSASPTAVAKAETDYLDKGVSDECLMLFGIGDGGGGPGEDHLEMLKREKNLNGLSPVTQEPALKFFNKLEEKQDRYQTWAGELYLEAHQGTYTTQGRNKRYNRKTEYLLHDLELFSVIASHTAGQPYPAEKLEQIWKEVLLYQFHDILPGSAITRVYTESRDRYKLLQKQLEAMLEKALVTISGTVDSASNETSVLAFNSLGWARKEWVPVGDGWSLAEIPAAGFAVVGIDGIHTAFDSVSATNRLLQNDLLKIIFNEDGTIGSIIDKENSKEIISGVANRLAVYNDSGDAWDFPISYDTVESDCFHAVEVDAWTEGPRAVVCRKYRYGDSGLTQKVQVTAGSRRIDFITEVDWNESEKMLRTSFPVTVSANEATCDIQFGNIKRPTHRNTSWDMAKYEICAHKWVDLSQPDYGVALINDCKYGYQVGQNTIDLNLLRSPHNPDPTADRGHHEFTYALYPHTGNFIEGGVVRAGYDLNVPIRTIVAQGKAASVPGVKASFLWTDSENIVIETVKKAEDSNGIIVRMYECHGSETKTKLHFNFAYQSAQIVDLMEHTVESDKFDSKTLELRFSPYEIHTVLISFS